MTGDSRHIYQLCLFLIFKGKSDQEGSYQWLCDLCHGKRGSSKSNCCWI